MFKVFSQFFLYILSSSSVQQLCKPIKIIYIYICFSIVYQFKYGMRVVLLDFHRLKSTAQNCMQKTCVDQVNSGV